MQQCRKPGLGMKVTAVCGAVRYGTAAVPDYSYERIVTHMAPA
jgi:hypothetical protein